jgi:hypothetical protein
MRDLLDPAEPLRPWDIDLGRGLDSGEKAPSVSARVSLDGSNGGRKGGLLLLEERPSSSGSPSIFGRDTCPPSLDTDIRGKISLGSDSPSSGIAAGGGDEIVLEIGRTLFRLGGVVMLLRSVRSVSDDPLFSLWAIESLLLGPTTDMRNILFRLFSSCLGFAAGKYSPRWLAMSSLGGR